MGNFWKILASLYSHIWSHWSRPCRNLRAGEENERRTGLHSKGSGCGSVGRALASDARGPQCDPAIGKLLYQTLICLLSTVLKRLKIKKKEAMNGPFLKRTSLWSCYVGIKAKSRIEPLVKPTWNAWTVRTYI